MERQGGSDGKDRDKSYMDHGWKNAAGRKVEKNEVITTITLKQVLKQGTLPDASWILQRKKVKK